MHGNVGRGNDRGNSESSEFQQPRIDGGLLDDSLLQIVGRMYFEGENAGEGIQLEEEGNNDGNLEDEKNLELLAKSKNAWLDNADEYLEKLYGKYFAHGSEAFVYRKDAVTVIKTRSFIGYNTIKQALVSIKIHNTLFPETALKIIAFGRSYDEFTAVLEQKNINGTFATKEEIENFVKERFNAIKDESVIGDNSYKNEKYLLQDLKPKNVLKVVIGNINKFFVVDGDFYYRKN